MERRKEGPDRECVALRSPSFTASVLLGNFHLFALGDRDAVANGGGEGIDRSVDALCACRRVSDDLGRKTESKGEGQIE